MFIVFEGVDRVGKTTAIELTAELLCKEGHNVVMISESSDPVVQYIKQTKLPLDDIVPMMFQIREEHQLLIDKFIRSRDILLWDRYFDSTYVYGYEFLKSNPDYEDELFNFYIPDLTLYLHANVDLIMSRIGVEKDRFTGSRDSLELYLDRYEELYDDVSAYRNIHQLDVSNMDRSEVSRTCTSKVLGLFNS